MIGWSEIISSNGGLESPHVNGWHSQTRHHSDQLLDANGEPLINHSPAHSESAAPGDTPPASKRKNGRRRISDTLRSNSQYFSQAASSDEEENYKRGSKAKRNGLSNGKPGILGDSPADSPSNRTNNRTKTRSGLNNSLKQNNSYNEYNEDENLNNSYNTHNNSNNTSLNGHMRTPKRNGINGASSNSSTPSRDQNEDTPNKSRRRREYSLSDYMPEVLNDSNTSHNNSHTTNGAMSSPALAIASPMTPKDRGQGSLSWASMVRGQEAESPKRAPPEEDKQRGWLKMSLKLTPSRSQNTEAQLRSRQTIRNPSPPAPGAPAITPANLPPTNGSPATNGASQNLSLAAASASPATPKAPSEKAPDSLDAVATEIIRGIFKSAESSRNTKESVVSHTPTAIDDIDSDRSTSPSVELDDSSSLDNDDVDDVTSGQSQPPANQMAANGDTADTTVRQNDHLAQRFQAMLIKENHTQAVNYTENTEEEGANGLGEDLVDFHDNFENLPNIATSLHGALFRANELKAKLMGVNNNEGENKPAVNQNKDFSLAEAAKLLPKEHTPAQTGNPLNLPQSFLSNEAAAPSFPVYDPKAPVGNFLAECIRFQEEKKLSEGLERITAQLEGYLEDSDEEDERSRASAVVDEPPKHKYFDSSQFDFRADNTAFTPRNFLKDFIPAESASNTTQNAAGVAHLRNLFGAPKNNHLGSLWEQKPEVWLQLSAYEDYDMTQDLYNRNFNDPNADNQGR